MERYENLGLVGEGSYGMVLKCRHKETNQIVAIKKFIESEDDKMVKKIAMREIRMLKQLRHENLVNLLEVFRRKKRLYLVFEFVDRTVLDDLEKRPDGLDDIVVKKICFQVLRGLEFCHSHNIIHRDVKPENILVSKSGIVKLCDFGFARTLATGPGEVFTDYVATRWYRAPELLVGDVNYGKAVDIWAIGCLLFEVITGDPLFPGDSDIDQLFHITERLGNLTQRHQEIFHKNPLFTGMRLPNVKSTEPFGKNNPQITPLSNALILKSLSLDASQRLSCLEMMKHEFFQQNNFAINFLETLKQKIEKETATNPLLKSLASQKESHDNITSRGSKSEKDKKRKDIKEPQELKKKKDTKPPESHTSVPHYPSIFSNESKKTTNDTSSKKTKNNDDNKSNPNNKSPNKENGSYSPTAETKQHKQTPNDSERSETKLSLRTPLDVSVNMPGNNLPGLSNVAAVNRAHGHDVIKQKKMHSKKSTTKYEQPFHPVAEKIQMHSSDKTKSFEETKEKIKKKDSKRDVTEVDSRKVSGLTLPSVKGVEAKQAQTSPLRDVSRKPYVSTIPHIHNIDPFANGHNNNRESPTSMGRPHRDGNLPAV